VFHLIAAVDRAPISYEIGGISTEGTADEHRHDEPIISSIPLCCPVGRSFSILLFLSTKLRFNSDTDPELGCEGWAVHVKDVSRGILEALRK
jgi:hypothetical protein